MTKQAPVSMVSMFLRRKRKQPRLLFTPKDWLKIKPLRNPAVEWKEGNTGKVTILLRRRKTGSIKQKLFLLFAPLPPQKSIILDDPGSYAWKLCDGQHTVQEIIHRVQEKYRLQRQESEVAVTSFLRRLMKKKLIGFTLPRPKPKHSGVSRG